MPRAVRFRVPDGETTFDDLVHGPITFDARRHRGLRHPAIGRPARPITSRSSCDDVDMAITHVVRGDDHISNTPKQILLYQALGAPVPAFAHVPLILGPDKKRLSKRHGATSVERVRAQGYLPEAMVNFLALLGWSPGGDRGDLHARRADCALHARGHQRRQRRLQPREARLVQPAAPRAAVHRRLIGAHPSGIGAAGLWDDALLHERREWFGRVLALLVPRARRLGDFATAGRAVPRRPWTTTIRRRRQAPGGARHWPRTWARSPTPIGALEPFDEATSEAALRAVAEQAGIKFGALVHATRIAVTGRAVSPGLFETLVLIGRDHVVARLESLARFLTERRGAVAEGA